MITLFKTLEAAMKIPGVVLSLFTGGKRTTILSGYQSVNEAVSDSRLASKVFGGDEYEVVDNRIANNMTLRK